jgi:hypothetical protein
MHLSYAPVLLGSGECLMAGMDLPALGYQVHTHTTSCLDVMITKKKPLGTTLLRK